MGEGRERMIKSLPRYPIRFVVIASDQRERGNLDSDINIAVSFGIAA